MYMVARGYETAYETTLHFTNGTRLPVRARLVGELNQRIVIHDAQGRPAAISGLCPGPRGNQRFRWVRDLSRTLLRFAHDPVFDEIMKLGQAYRKGQRLLPHLKRP